MRVASPTLSGFGIALVQLRLFVRRSVYLTGFDVIVGQAAFKNFMGAIITRKNSLTGLYYRDDPAILGWEIANEPSAPGDPSGDILQVVLIIRLATQSCPVCITFQQ